MTEGENRVITAEESKEIGPVSSAVEMTPDRVELRAKATKLARSLAWIPGQLESRDFSERYRKLEQAFRPVLDLLGSPPLPSESADFRALRDDLLLLEGELQGITGTFGTPHKIPQVRT